MKKRAPNQRTAAPHLSHQQAVKLLTLNLQIASRQLEEEMRPQARAPIAPKRENETPESTENNVILFKRSG